MHILIEEGSIIHVYPNLIQILVEVMYTNLRHILVEEDSILLGIDDDSLQVVGMIIVSTEPILASLQSM